MRRPLCCSRRFLDTMISFRRRHVIVKSKWPALAWGRGGQSGNRTRRQVISPQPPILLIIACPTKAILVISRDKIQTNKHIWTFVSDGKTGIEFSDRIKKTHRSRNTCTGNWNRICFVRSATLCTRNDVICTRRQRNGRRFFTVKEYFFFEFY